MSGRYLLDTNIVIALFATESPVLDRVQEIAELFIPSVGLGELYYGAQHSGRAAENIARIDEFAAGTVILNCDAETAKWYGDIKNRLRRKGQPIPENDIWIAALCFQHNLRLASRDAHFNAVEELDVEVW
jgi:tRNA(fMet)-specific endonuclease VapC